MKLPELFRVIIEHDTLRPDVTASVVSLPAYRGWLDYRDELRRAAQSFIKRQRGDGGSAGAQ